MVHAEKEEHSLSAISISLLLLIGVVDEKIATTTCQLLAETVHLRRYYIRLDKDRISRGYTWN